MPEENLGLVWERERRAPGRQAPSVERIVEHAVALADAEGAAAVTMRRVAAGLGSGTASLYRYVTSRDELVELMVDAVLGEDAPTPPTGDWRADLTAVARRTRAVLLRHPWLGAELTGRPAIGPNALRHTDATLGAAAGLTPDVTRASQAVRTLMAYVHGATAAELAEARAHYRPGMTKDEWRAGHGPYVRRIVAEGEHPHLARMILEAADPDTEEGFGFGLDCVLNGLAAAVHGGTTAAGGDA